MTETTSRSEIAFEFGLSRERAPKEIIRIVYEQPVPRTSRMIRCVELAGSRRDYEECKKRFEDVGGKLLLCHRYVLEATK